MRPSAWPNSWRASRSTREDEIADGSSERQRVGASGGNTCVSRASVPSADQFPTPSKVTLISASPDVTCTNSRSACRVHADAAVSTRSASSSPSRNRTRSVRPDLQNRCGWPAASAGGPAFDDRSAAARSSATVRRASGISGSQQRNESCTTHSRVAGGCSGTGPPRGQDFPGRSCRPSTPTGGARSLIPGIRITSSRSGNGGGHLLRDGFDTSAQEGCAEVSNLLGAGDGGAPGHALILDRHGRPSCAAADRVTGGEPDRADLAVAGRLDGAAAAGGDELAADVRQTSAGV